jgi:hypothetical protein
MSRFEMLRPPTRRRTQERIRCGAAESGYLVVADLNDFEPVRRADLGEAIDVFDRLRHQYPGVRVRVLPWEDGAL